jgi:hypothetical protein
MSELLGRTEVLVVGAGAGGVGGCHLVGQRFELGWFVEQGSTLREAPERGPSLESTLPVRLQSVRTTSIPALRRLLESVQIDPELVVGGNQAEVCPPDPQHRDRLRDGHVNFL